MNQVYVNDQQNPDLAQRAEILQSTTRRHTEHKDINLSGNDLPEGDYIELSDLGQHRTNTNFHQQQMTTKGKILSLHNSYNLIMMLLYYLFILYYFIYLLYYMFSSSSGPAVQRLGVLVPRLTI